MNDLIEQNKSIVRRFNMEFVQGNKQEVFDEIISPDFINHSAAPGTPNDAQGVKYFFNGLLRPAIADLTVHIHQQVGEDDRVVTLKSFHGTHTGDFFGIPPTGRNITITVIDILRIKDGKFVEHWAQFDLSDVIARLRS